MEIEFSLRLDDLEAFTRYHGKLPSVQTPFSWSAALGVVVILLAVASSLHFTVSISQEVAATIGVLIVLVGGGLGSVWFQLCMNRSRVKAQWKDPRNEWIFRDVRVAISPEQLRSIARGSTTTYYWCLVWHIGCTRKHVFLCISRTTAVIIPRRAFCDEAQCEEFVALARQYQQNWREQKPKSTGIITSLPPESTAIRSSDIP